MECKGLPDIPSHLMGSSHPCIPTTPCTRQVVVTRVRHLPMAHLNREHTDRWSWARHQRKCLLLIMPVCRRSSLCISKPRCEPVDNVLRQWISSKTESQLQSNELPAIWTQVNPSDCNLVRLTTHLPLTVVLACPIQGLVGSPAGGTAEHSEAALLEAITETLSATWKREPWRKDSWDPVLGTEKVVPGDKSRHIPA
jgi:hypothetical protein